jgi:VanZ family protein
MTKQPSEIPTQPGRLAIKFCSVALLALCVITALGPANWQPRSTLGWELDHVLGYFVITSLVCFAWPRPVLVAGALVVFAPLLEGLQSLTPDRSPNPMAALYGAAGVVMAALLAELLIRTRVARDDSVKRGPL